MTTASRVTTLFGVLMILGAAACSSTATPAVVKNDAGTTPVDSGGGSSPDAANGTPDAANGDDTGTTADAGAGSCYRASPPDSTSLPACCADQMGKAKCAPTSQLPPGAEAGFEQKECTAGNLCVPTALLLSGGKTPKACKSLGGMAGVCMSVCVPMVGMNKAILPPDICEADERCAPCINPLTQKSSGACEIGTAGVCP